MLHKTQRGLLFLLVSIGLLSLAAVPAAAFTVTISFDENCNGLLTNSSGFVGALPCAPLNDPGPGGLNNTLFYSMLNPPGLQGGDLVVMEPTGSLISDILRFDPNVLGGGLFVYSDNFGGTNLLADIGLPTGAYTNTVTLSEAAGINTISYTPTAGQPGFVAGAAGPVTYNFTSSESAPEPVTSLLLFAPLAAMMALRLKRKPLAGK